ncbi:MliC family protein [Neisseria sp.]|uniref:MliC family protein n=1 Tax=Neisseria sp. TaxID=192066 RepID=UPI0035A06D00
MNIRFTAVLFASALAACHSDRPQTPAAQSVPAPAAQAAETFQCDNGITVTVQQLDTDRIRLSATGGETTVLTIARAGSGERYVAEGGVFGKGGEWHRKGREARFGYGKVHGGQAATTCRI